MMYCWRAMNGGGALMVGDSYILDEDLPTDHLKLLL